MFFNVYYFCAHYRLEAVFCNPYSGHEKGNVEIKCGYAKRIWAVPIPAFESHEQLADYFATQAQQDREQMHYAKKERIADLRERDRASLLTFPSSPYEAFRMETAVVNKYGEIRVDEHTIPLYGRVQPGKEVLVQTFWDRLVILSSSQQLIQEVPRPYTEKVAEIPWVQVFTNLLRKPRSVTHSQFIGMLPEELQQYVKIADVTVRKERLQALIHWCGVYEMKQIQDVLERTGHEATIAQLTAALGVQQTCRDIPTTWTETLSPPGTQTHESLHRYGRLMGVI